MLNSSVGGYHLSYEPTSAEWQCLQRIELMPFSRDMFFIANDHPVYQANIQRIRASISQIFQQYYLNRLPAIDPSFLEEFNEELIDFFTASASPLQTRVLAGAVPFVIFGKDITQEDYFLRRGFFEGSRAGTTTKSMIYSASSQDSETAALNPPAFIDQWPCRPGLRRQYEHSDGIVDVLNEAVALALQQLRVTIIASLGFQPSACCRSNFHGR